MDTVLTKTTLLYSSLTQKLPHLPQAVIPLCELVVRTELELSKSQWKREQEFDFSLKTFISLMKKGTLSEYQAKKTDTDDLKCMLRLRKEFFIDSELLYRKAYFKNTDKVVNQFVMPRQFRKRTVLVCYEDYGHLGMDRVLILLQERFYWPKMSDDVRLYIRTCDHCTRFKQEPKKEKMQTITASYPLELIHLDFLTIGGKQDKRKNVLVVTDHFTRYAQCYVTDNQTAETVADVMVNQYFSHYGWPEKILTDKGRCFENHLFQEICDQAKVKKLRTTSYHPQTNGQCERFNKTLLRMLGTIPVHEKKQWQDWVPTLVHAYNCSTSSVTGFSPYFLIYGHQPKLPIDIEYGVSLEDSYDDCKSYAEKLQHRLRWAYDAAQQNIDKNNVRQKNYYDKSYKCATLEKDDLVMLRVVKPGTDYKIADKWEQDPWIILHKRTDSPDYTIQNTRTKEIRELHRNLLYPLRLVRSDDNTPQLLTLPLVQQAPVGSSVISARQAQILTEAYFACDCKNCTETV